MTMSNSINFDISFNRTGRSESAKNPQVFKILVLGNFTGHKSSDTTIPEQKLFGVDGDNLDERLRKLGPELDLSLESNPGESIHIDFEEIEDFHPDRVYARVGLFSELKDLKKRLQDPASFDEAAKQIQGNTDSSENSRDEKTSPSNDSFSDLLGKPVTGGKSAPQNPAVTKLIRKFVDPHITDDPNPEQQRLLESVDDAVSVQMNEILHHKDFQSLEAAWKGLDFLIRTLELDAELSVSILDISKNQLSRELVENTLAEHSILYKSLITEAGETHGTEAWSLIAGLYNFEMNDSRLLNAIGNLAGHCGAPFVSGYAFQSLPSEPDSDWRVLQQSQAGSYIHLCTPGVLLRLPYGENTDEIDCFEYEEMPNTPVLDHYLWGNAALAFVALIGQTFSREGWRLQPGSISQLGDLPVHSYKIDGEYEMTPCGGYWLSANDADNLSKLGLIAVLSVKNSNSIRITDFLSLAGGPMLI